MPQVKVVIPPILADKTNGKMEHIVFASTLGNAIEELIRKYGDNFKSLILDESGKPSRILNFLINGKNAKFLSDMETQLNDGDEISIFYNIGGG